MVPVELDGATTVRLAAPDLPPARAVIVTGPPAATPVTSPLLVTVASAVLEDVHEYVRPGNGCPAEFSAVAPKLIALPTTTEAVVGVTATEATVLSTGGAVTVICADPDFPAALAVMNAWPGATAVTRPDELTDATPAAELVH
jgi:hypothetical protein